MKRTNCHLKCVHTHTPHANCITRQGLCFITHTGTQTYTLLKMIDNSESSTAVVVKENLLCSGFQSLGSYGKMSCTYLSHATANVHTHTHGLSMLTPRLSSHAVSMPELCDWLISCPGWCQDSSSGREGESRQCKPDVGLTPAPCT